MISRLHQKLGTAGFIISIVALVAALGGGAYAASGGLSGKQKKEVEKIAKKYAGRPGATGAQGAAGPAGGAGPKGDSGAAGGNGTNGADGAGVTSKAVAAGSPKCAGLGGSEFTSAGGTTFACNGKEGISGFATQLPSGETERGVWVVGAFTKAQEEEGVPAHVSITFPYPLPQAESPIIYVKVGETGPSECAGSSEEPTAEPGFVCVYEAGGSGAELLVARNPEVAGGEGAGRVGTDLVFKAVDQFGYGYGVWAATAP